MGGREGVTVLLFFAYDSMSQNVVARNPDPVLPRGTTSDGRSTILLVDWPPVFFFFTWPPVLSPASVILLQ